MAGYGELGGVFINRISGISLISRGFLGGISGISWWQGGTQVIIIQCVAAAKNLYILYIHYKVYNWAFLANANAQLLYLYGVKTQVRHNAERYLYDRGGRGGTPDVHNPVTLYPDFFVSVEV